MKKLLAGLFVFGFLFAGIGQVQASVLGDALLKIKNLNKEMVSLQSKLKASALDSSVSTTSASHSQTIILKTGWNTISFNVNPSNLSLKSVFDSMNPSNGEIISNEDGVTATYMNGLWEGGFTTIDTSKAYKIKVSSDKTLTVNGSSFININTPIYLRSGTNLVPYYPTIERDAVTVFSSIKTTCLKKVMDESGKSYENFGAFGGWKNNIGTLKPGEGYTVITTDSCILNYGDANTTPSIKVLSPNGGEVYTKGNTQNTGDFLNFKATIANAEKGSSYRVYLVTKNDITWKSAYHQSIGGADGEYQTNPIVIDGSMQLNDTVKPGNYYLLVEYTFNDGSQLRDFSDKVFKINSTATSTPSIIVGYSSSNITIGNGSEGSVLSFDVSSDTSDVNINSYKISFENKGSGSSRLSDYVSQIGVYTAMGRVALLDISDFVKVGNVYSKTLVIPSDRNIVFAGKSRNFYITVKTNPSLDSINLNNFWKISANNIRYTLPSGFVNTSTGYAESTFIVKSENASSTLKTTADISVSTGTAFVTASIVGSSMNKEVSYWKLLISCESGVVASADKPNLCGTEIRMDTYNMANPLEDYLLLTAGVKNNNSVSSKLILSLSSYNSSNIRIRGDKKEIIIPSSNSTTPSITVLSPNGGETYQAGQKITVKWESKNIVGNVNIGMQGRSGFDMNDAFRKISDISVPNTGSATYTIPNSSLFYSSGGLVYNQPVYYIAVYVPGGIQDVSDDWFAIKPNTSDNGCSNGEVYSSTTGQKCLVVIPTPIIDIGCLSGYIYSSTTGKLCPVSITSPKTPTAVNNLINSCGQTLFTDLLRIGSKGDQAESLQVLLNDQGYLSDDEIDGSFGYKTWKALKAFQIANGLKGDGVMGKQTRAYFNALWNKQCLED